MRICLADAFRLLADGIRRRKDTVVHRPGFSNKASSLALGVWDKSNYLTHVFTPVMLQSSFHLVVGLLTPTSKPLLAGNVHAEFDPFVADENGGPCDQLADFMLALAAERAMQCIVGE